MSEGLKLIAAAVAENKPGILLRIDRNVLLGQEAVALDYTIRHYREHNVLPQVATILENTGVRVGTAREPAEYYEANCYRRHAVSEAKEAYKDLREGLEETTIEGVEKAAQAAYEILQALRIGRPVDRIHSGQSLGTAVMEHIRRGQLATREIPGVTSGWAAIDEMTGGYQNSDLITWVARPSVGKTWMLLYQAWSAMVAGHRPLIASTEMSPEQLARRLAAMALGLNPHVLKTGRVDTRHARRIEEFFMELERAARLHVTGLGFNASVGQLDEDCVETHPDAIYVDGVYLLKPNQKGNMSRTEKVSYVFDELKTLAMVRNLPLIVTTQFNRAAGKGGKEGSLETIGMSDTIGQNSSIVLAIRLGNTVDPERSREFEFLKGREGEGGKLTINFKFAPTDFSVISDEEALLGMDGSEAYGA